MTEPKISKNKRPPMPPREPDWEDKVWENALYKGVMLGMKERRKRRKLLYGKEQAANDFLQVLEKESPPYKGWVIKDGQVVKVSDEEWEKYNQYWKDHPGEKEELLN